MNYFCDGGLKEICVTNDNGEVFIEQIDGTNNENEYRAMILALERAQNNDTIFADSQLIVNQLTKGWKVKAENLYGFYVYALRLSKEKNITIEWVSRDFNKAGWILEGRTGDHKKNKFEFLQ